MNQSVYARGALKQLPETLQDKKETQLILNLAEVMETLADELTSAAFTHKTLRPADVSD